ncbi:methyl-accepting chemotaxis protein [Marinibactrum halimedae]|uniref:Protein PilJ n=1 Tax=Marinibactrum halimedae TaxID=1444977 RepID=A0AA37T554_9GAMM|nr:methyl-accepting chemotaxis protein [Marinibactrum halimedae]MCD9458328.1 methyl-accepting chemotaxis protein [Marinibactrum halimedae]GLS27044.1 protein PilJ [Marinibactrum halimedae]
MKTESSNLMASIKANAALSMLIVVLVILLAVITFGIITSSQEAARDQEYLQIVADLRASSYRVTSLPREATSGNETAFAELEQVVSSMTSSWEQLNSGGGSSQSALRPSLSQYETVWQRVKSNAQTIITNKDTIIFLNDVAKTLNESLPELQAEHNNIVEILLENSAPGEQIAVAQMQSWRAERIGRNIDKMLRGGGDATQAADQFNLDANLFGKVLTGMKDGDTAMGISRVTDGDAIESLGEISSLFEFVNSSVREIFEASPALFSARQASEELLTDSPEILEALGTLAVRIEGLDGTRVFNPINLGILAGLAAVVMAAIAVVLLRGTRRRLLETAETNERNQNAILRLLDELADLADGDLTTTATVTEDFTGAIADSINYTIDQLRVLVSRINETSVNVASASQDTQQTALHLAEAAEHQAQEIAGASAAVNEMAVTIDQVSANAAESASVAERAVSIANNGAKVVQNTIHGMDTIREQIQDTSKRIKRLGESSQEIGDIVSLINDIADQTNILALNAAIQASMAGDAGRGFAVVADEVQRLAERSAAATKQIEALVKTIQNDTNEAVISMEQTTAEVVRGARLAQDAGVALEEIENVSTSLAELIQNISNAARQQASSAGHISNTMNVIQEITSQTSSGTSATAGSIGNLASMAMDLRESVAGFTLPEDGSVLAGDAAEAGGFGSMQGEESDYIATLDEPVDIDESGYDEELSLDDGDDVAPLLVDEDDDKRSGATA